MIILVVGGVLLFGADKIPKLFRSAGQAKKEFLIGQAEADIASERAREEARRQAASNAATLTPSATGVATPIPDPTTGATITSPAPPL